MRLANWLRPKTIQGQVRLMVVALLVIGGIASWTAWRARETADDVEVLIHEVQSSRYRSIVASCESRNEDYVRWGRSMLAFVIAVRPRLVPVMARNIPKPEPDCEAFARGRVRAR